MAALPVPQHQTAEAIYALHARRSAAQTPRPYLGWSEIGDPCDRALWLRFRWAETKAFDGRMARLFDTGHREEARVLQELRDAGMEVWDRDPATGGQFAVSSCSGHFRGHLDAVVRGLPEAPKTPHLVDVKTVKAKKLNKLIKKGIEAMYPRYWAQGHGYMGHMKLERAAFIFVCKDDERIHVERFAFDRKVFERYENRAARIIAAAEPPQRISEDPAWFECKFCRFHSLCHGTTAPQVNCRTCAHSTPGMDGDGRWVCSVADPIDIPPAIQRAGCGAHRFIPILLERFAKTVDMAGDGVVYEMADGRQFVNGTPPAGLTSAEIRACADKTFLPHAADGDIRQLREQFPNARLAA